VQLSELFPRLAGCADKLALVRSLVGGQDEHASTICLTGHGPRGPQPAATGPAPAPCCRSCKGQPIRPCRRRSCWRRRWTTPRTTTRGRAFWALATLPSRPPSPARRM
jgi:hypothetical protein